MSRVRVGFQGGPGMIQMTDRWNRPVNCWEASDWSRITSDSWEMFSFFQEDLPDTKDVSLMSDIVRRKLAMSNGHVLWELDVSDRHCPSDWRRQVLVMNSECPRMVRWSLADCYIRRPYWLIVAWAKNRLTSPHEYD